MAAMPALRKEAVRALMTVWQDSQKKLFLLAGPLDQTERRALLQFFEPTNDRHISDWLLFEAWRGYDTWPTSEIHVCATVGRLADRLKSEPKNRELFDAGLEMVFGMIDGDMFAEDGIQYYDEAPVAIELLLRSAAGFTLDLRNLHDLGRLRSYLHSLMTKPRGHFTAFPRVDFDVWEGHDVQGLFYACTEILESSSSRRVVEEELKAARTYDKQEIWVILGACEAAGVDTGQLVLATLTDEVSGLWHLAFDTVDRQILDRVVVLARQKLELLLDPEVSQTKFDSLLKHNRPLYKLLHSIVQGLEHQPGLCEDLVLLALRSSTFSLKSIAIDTLAEWGRTFISPAAKQELLKIARSHKSRYLREDAKRVLAGELLGDC